MIIDGKKIASNIISDLKELPKPDKILAAVFVGVNPQSKSFLRQKEILAQDLGIKFQLFQFKEDILEADLIKEIKKIGDDEEIGGMIVQLPLPRHYDREKILAAVNPKKDVDALTLESQKLVNPLPVEVVKDILRSKKYEIRDKIVAVVGRGFLVGKPITEWLNGKCKELIVLNSKSDLSEIKKADLVITGVGKGGLIKPEMLKPGAGVIDFGYDILDGKIKGDFDLEPLKAISYKLKASWYTPTPGGTGPILVAEIFKNFYKLNS